MSFEEFIKAKRLLESDDVRDQIKLMFCLISLTKNKKIKKKTVEKFLKTLSKTGTLTDVNSKTPIDGVPIDELLIKEFAFDKDGLIEEDEVIEEMLKNDSFTKFVSTFEPRQYLNTP